MNEPITSEVEETDASYTVTHNPDPTESPEPATAPTPAGTIPGAVDAGATNAGLANGRSASDPTADDHADHDHAGHDHDHDHSHDSPPQPAAPIDAGSPDGEDSDIDMVALNETLEYIRPALQADGGDLVLLGVKGGTVNLQLVGACGGCPMSTMTLKQGIERIIFDRVPGATEVVAI